MVVSDQHLVKGPFIETLPDFEKGVSIGDMVADGTMTAHWGALRDGALFYRPLHAHQDAAVRRDENFLVATGSGSGKTECFLYPMIDDILREGELSRPGVRAIIVYPLNALANDQMHRISRLLFQDLGNPGITLGRYTGQVASSATREEEAIKLLQSPTFEENFPDFDEVPANWLLSRSEMRQTPPHILITNYAMLEHILLLPSNRALLDRAQLKWLVLDEIHTYAGAQAIEVAFLLRRLKTYLGISPGATRCVGTSASLDPGRKDELAEFAGNLFGEPFAGPGSVITSRRKRHLSLAARPVASGLTPQDWSRAAQLAQTARSARKVGGAFNSETWNEECDLEDLAALRVAENKDLGDGLIETLGRFAEIAALVDALEGGAIHLDVLAGSVFPEAEAGLAAEALVSLISVSVLAVSSGQSVYPLLPARYHLIAASIEAVSLVLDAAASEKFSDIVVGGFTADDGETPAYQLMICRNCGEPYLEAWLAEGYLKSVMERRARRTVLRLLDGPRASEVDEGTDDETEDVEDELLCLRVDPATGELVEIDDPAGVRLEIVELREDEEERAFYMKKCSACGYAPRRYAEPITPIHPGDDAFAAVCGQALLETLPERRPSQDVPMKGRNLLVFSDNRQDAAFFAPFFERTSRDQAIRSAILKSVEDAGRIDLDNLTTAVRRRLDVLGLRLYSGGLTSSREIGENEEIRLKALIVSELTVLSRLRTSLEGLGLVMIDYSHSSRVENAVARALPESLKDDARALTLFLLKAIRTHRAVSKLPSHGIRLDDDSIWTSAFAQENRAIALEPNPRSSLVMSYLPARGRRNRFTYLLEDCLGVDPIVGRDVLTAFVRALKSSRSPCAQHGKGLGLKLDSSLILADGRGVPLYRCVSCGARTQFGTAGKCQSYKCGSRIVEIGRAERDAFEEANHYVRRYRETPLLGIAREHTAAIAVSMRGLIEQKFKEGEVNLLSCTTTMEMGVDLGDLEAVHCKNVPPNISNYLQRAGRAGRRAQAAPIVLTTARSSRYDQAKFREFGSYLADLPAVPYLSIDNANFFRRHQMATALSGFLRHRLRDMTRSGAPRLTDVFGAVLDENASAAFGVDLSAWIAGESGRAALTSAERLIDTLPAELRGIGLSGGDLETALRRRVGDFRDAIELRWRTYQRQIEALDVKRAALPTTASADRQKIARKIDRMTSQQTRFMKQMLVDQLSRRALIPTYSFPVHSVSLEVISSQRHNRDNAVLELDRDGAIGISEYAPGSEVIAGGRVWTSRGIVKKDKFSGEDTFVDQGRLRVCEECFYPDVTAPDKSRHDDCPQCGAPFSATNAQRKFIRPVGFLTSYGESQGKDPGATRIKVRATDDVRLLTTAPPESYTDTDIAGIKTFHAPGSNCPDPEMGRIIGINRGPKGGGFVWCPYCEHAEPVRASPQGWQQETTVPEHRNPRSDEICPFEGKAWPTDLGHVFETDVRNFMIEPLRSASTGHGEAVEPTERIRKTLREAMRLAVARLLETDPRDIRATDQRISRCPVIVLYDAVAGGAGYTTRLTTDRRFTMRDILLAVSDILNCSNRNCITSCTRCLNDYSNQRNWQDFERLPALSWVEDILGANGVTAPPRRRPGTQAASVR